MKNCIYSITVVWSMLFFAISSIFGITYEGSDTSGLYLNMSAGVSVLCVLFVFIGFFKNAYLTLTEIVSCLILLFFVLIGFVTGYRTSSMYGRFVLFCVPSSLVGLYYARQNSIASMIKWVDVWMLLLSISFFVKVPTLIGMVVNEIAWYSQSLSYDAACAILMNLYMMAYGEHYSRFKFFSSSFYKVACWFFLVVQFIALFIGGGRGAVVIVFVGVICLMMGVRKRYRHGLLASFIAILFLIVGFYYINQKGSEDFTYVLEKNITRSFSMLDESLTLDDRTSGRNMVYSNSINAIINSPIIGYGLFKYVEQINPQPYPHNIFLEWALQYGIIFAITCLLSIVVLLYKYKHIKIHNNELVLLSPLIVYSFGQLLFSNSYLQAPVYWFVIAFLFNYKPLKQSIITS